MKFCTHKNVKSIVTIGLVAMLFSCKNNSNEVRAFFTVQNSPVGIAKNVVHIYKDSGSISSKLITPLLHDFSNRSEHPYNEFPKGIKIVSYQNNRKDSVTISGNYALSYLNTQISELDGDVVIINHSEKSKLETEQLFWDQKTNYFFSEKKFTLTTATNTLHGVGFESKEDLSKFSAKRLTGDIPTNEN